MASINELLKQAPETLPQSESPKLDVEILLQQVLACERSYLLTWPEQQLTVSQLAAFKQLIARRNQGEPIAYILGRREFWDLNLKVSTDTLIPRPETEHIIEWVLARFDHQTHLKVLDLGTGTGAIALTLAKHRPHWQLVAVDKSPAALQIAHDNAKDHQLNQVTFKESHWFNEIAAQRFDLIISNPPYVDAASAYLEQGDVRFEPKQALIAENRGLADLHQIIQDAPSYLANGGFLVLEHGFDQALSLQSSMQARGFHELETLQDFANLDRVTLGKWS